MPAHLERGTTERLHRDSPALLLDPRDKAGFHRVVNNCSLASLPLAVKRKTTHQWINYEKSDSDSGRRIAHCRLQRTSGKQ